MNKHKLILPISILLGCVVLGGFFYVSQIEKLNNTNLKANNLTSDKLVEKKYSYPVPLIYNSSTGELYPLLPNGANVHTCVWTISGDHGSEMTLTTKSSVISNDTDNDLKLNNFLPPRVPIYVTCINWNNESYYGFIGEYK